MIKASFSQKLLVDGLEQAQDTRPPVLFIRDRFKAFVEDELDDFIGPESHRVLAHPTGAGPGILRVGDGTRTAIAIGPERGWVTFEVELLAERGFRAMSFGRRTLRVEAFVPFVVGWIEARRQRAPNAGDPTGEV